MAKIPPGVGPQHSQVVVLVGATGDLSRRKLLPGLFYLSSAGFIPGCRIIGVSLDQIDADGFRKIAREALDQFSSRKVKDADWAAFAETLDYVPIGAGADALKAAVAEAERKLGNENRRVHYLSVPPNAALSVVVDGKENTSVVELTNPRLDGTSLTYDVRLLEGTPPAAGSNSALFIDWWYGPWGGVCNYRYWRGVRCRHPGW